MKTVTWIGSAKQDLSRFPEAVKEDVGYALFEAQQGRTLPSVKPLKGFGGAGVLEIIERYDGDAYRAVYTVKFGEAVYVLHCFQKKSKSGIKTPPQEIEMIKRRLKMAEEKHRAKN